MGTVIAVTSGKGGTGKTSVTGAVAASLAMMGRSVLCIDMDIGLRNLDISLGLNDRALMDFSDVALGRCPLSRADVDIGPCGLPAIIRLCGVVILHHTRRGRVSRAADVVLHCRERL